MPYRLIWLRISAIVAPCCKPKPDDPELTTTAVARGRWDDGAVLTNVEDVWVGDLCHGPAMGELEQPLP